MNAEIGSKKYFAEFWYKKVVKNNNKWGKRHGNSTN